MKWHRTRTADERYLDGGRDALTLCADRLAANDEWIAATYVRAVLEAWCGDKEKK